MRLNVPLLDDAELAAVGEVLASGYLTQGARTAQFEREVAGVTGTRHAQAVSSATTGLHLALVALGISPGTRC